VGYGGALIWTGLAYNLKQKYPGKQIIFVYKKSLLDFVLRRPQPDNVVYQNNEDIECVLDHITWGLRRRKFSTKDTIVVNMDNPDYFYWVRDTEEKMIYKSGRHVIQIACDVHNISNAELQPRIKLSDKEIDRANRLLKSHGLLPNQYICIEPNAKEDFTPNKAWFWENWRSLVESINRYVSVNNLSCKVVQVGAVTEKVLDGVVDLTGKTTFREVGYILGKALLLISCEGGLVHLARAVKKISIVLMSSLAPRELFSYPANINFYTDIECKNCGLKVPCPINKKCMRQITVEQVFEAVKSVLSATSIL
jgi:heptosyltransferase-1